MQTQPIRFIPSPEQNHELVAFQAYTLMQTQLVLAAREREIAQLQARLASVTKELDALKPPATPAQHGADGESYGGSK